MTQTAQETPEGARLEVTIQIDSDRWMALEHEGHPSMEIGKMIEREVENRINYHHTNNKVPVGDVVEISLRKFY